MTSYQTNVSALKTAFAHRTDIESIRLINFTEANSLPIWRDGKIIDRQIGNVAVAELTNGIFVGLIDGQPNGIATFRVVEALATEGN